MGSRSGSSARLSKETEPSDGSSCRRWRSSCVPPSAPDRKSPRRLIGRRCVDQCARRNGCGRRVEFARSRPFSERDGHLHPLRMACLEFSKSTPMTKNPKRPANTIESAACSERFDVAALRDVAGEKVFARGVAYHEDGQVEIITFDRTRVLARVI